ncbi:MAG: hypothetical protein AAGD07_16280 [Planctomycetota bacterium]
MLLLALCWGGLAGTEFAGAQDLRSTPPDVSGPFGTSSPGFKPNGTLAESLPLPPPAQTEPSPTASMNAETVLMTQRLALLQKRYDGLLDSYGRRHPSVVEVQREMRELRVRLNLESLAPTPSTQQRIDNRILEFDDRQLRRAVGLLIGRVLELETQVKELTQANTLLRQRFTAR